MGKPEVDHLPQAGKKGLQPTLSPSIDSAEVPTHNIQ